ncbi:hypothetical protein DVH05_024885 [Phytophthora capsici]|nr:hypothetical protein DVH05_024885 [Phytophthora capsici]
MDLIPGEFSAVLYWKSLQGSSRPWFSSPNALDGFAMGRVLAAVGEWSMDSLSVYHLERYKPTSVGEWSDVGDSVLQFTLPKATQVSLSYNLPLSQSDNPQFTSWTEDSWGRVETRLVIDGIAYRHMSSLVDGSVRGIKNARASMVLPLAGGSHSARLQWKNVDGSRWRAVSFITDQTSSYASIFISVNTWNNDPKIIAPTIVSGEEDKTVEIVGISISDTDSEMALDYEVTVTMSVKNGVLSLDPTPGITFSSGNGDRNEYLLFSGTLSSVNTYLTRMWYRSYLNWYGDDELRIKVVDQGVTGFTTATMDESSVMIRIVSVNDPPQLSVPSTQFLLEDQQISIFGVRVYDVDPAFAHSNSTFEVQLFVISGVLGLGSSGGVEMMEGDGVADKLLRFRGELHAINSALFEIKYRPDKDFNTRQHVERLGIRVRDFNYLDNTITDVFKSVSIEVQSVDDPVLIMPLEQFTITIRGYAIKLLGETNAPVLVRAQLLAMTPIGEIQLSTPSSSFPAGVTKLPAGDQPSSSVYLSGPLAGVSGILQSVIFTRAPSFYGYEVIFVRLSIGPEFGIVEDSTIQLNLRSNSSSEHWSISKVSPSRGKKEGGTTVSVTGKGFQEWPDEALWCRFGRSALVPATVESDILLTCVSPSASADLPKRTFIMVTNGDNFYSNPIVFVYEESWTVSSVSPTGGPRSGGTRVLIQGDAFPLDTALLCMFGNDTTTARVLSPSTVLCQAPMVTKDTTDVHLRLTTNSQDFTQPFLFSYQDSPEIDAINPPYGSSNGGDIIAITGSNFFADKKSNCVFNGTIVTPVSFKTSNLITCHSPAIDFDAVDSFSITVAVTFDGVSYPSPENFRVYAPPTVSSVSPPFITRSGDMLTVSGSQYQNLSSLSCHFSNGGPSTVASAIFVSPFVVQCRVPVLHRPGTWIGLLVSFSEASSQLRSSLNSLYLLRYAPLPSILSATPLTLLRIGNPPITLRGLGMMAFHSLWCNFVGAGSTQVTITSPTSAECATPFLFTKDALSLQILQVENILSQKTVLAVYEYVVVDPIEVQTVVPSLGLTNGGTIMTIFTDSKVLQSVEEYSVLKCKVGGTLMPAAVLNNTALTCRSPAVYKPVTVPVEIWIGKVAGNAASFTYVAAIRMEEVTPSRVSSAGGVTLHVTTSDLVFQGLSCLFGSIVVSAEIVAERTISCMSPPHLETFGLLWLVNGEGTIMSENALVLSFYSYADVVSISPANGIVFPNTIEIEMDSLSSAHNVECVLRANEVDSAIIVADIVSFTSATCRLPTDMFAPPVKLILSVAVDNFTVVDQMNLYLVPSLVVKSISPTVGFVGAKNLVRVELESIDLVLPEYVCSFGGMLATGNVDKAAKGSVIEFFSPVMNYTTEVSIAITANGVDFFEPKNIDAQSTPSGHKWELPEEERK